MRNFFASSSARVLRRPSAVQVLFGIVLSVACSGVPQVPSSGDGPEASGGNGGTGNGSSSAGRGSIDVGHTEDGGTTGGDSAGSGNVDEPVCGDSVVDAS